MSGLARALDGAGVVLAAGACATGLAACGGRAAGWAVVTCAVLAALAAGLLGAAAAARREPAPQAALAALGVAIVAWCGLALVPLPGGVLEAAAPHRSFVERAVPRGEDGIASWPAALEPKGLDLAAALAAATPSAPSLEPQLGPPVAAPVSFAPWATRTAVPVLAAFLGLLVVLASRARERAGLWLCGVVAFLSVLAAGAGLVLSRVAPGKALGLYEQPPNVISLPYGAFWSANHAAALFALACPVLLGAALDASVGLVRRALAGAGLLVVAAALLDVGSRGGILAGGVGALVLGAALVRARGHRVAGLALLLAAATGVALAFTVLSGRILGESFDETTSMRGSNRERAAIYRVEASIARELPWTGAGLGAFKTAHGAFRTEPDPLVPLHGESDWLETLAEGGLPLALLWIALLAALLAPALAAAWRGAPPLLSGLLAGTLATVAHAAVDFHLREPAVALAAVALAGTACAWARQTNATASVSDTKVAVTIMARAGVVLLVAGSLAWLAVAAPGEIRRDLAMRRGERLLADGEAAGAVAELEKAVAASPRHGDALALLGLAHEVVAQKSRPGAGRREARGKALEASMRAVEASPATLGAARRCATLLVQAGAEREALDAVRLALAVSAGQGATRRVAGQYLLRFGPSEEALGHLAFAFNALPVSRVHVEAVQLSSWMTEAAGGDPLPGLARLADPARQAWYVAELARAGRMEEARRCAAALAAGLPPGDVDALVPLATLVTGPEAVQLAKTLLPRLSSPAARARAGVALVRQGEPAEGAAILRAALEAGADSPEAWLALSDAETALGRPQEALRALDEGIERHPDSAGLRLRRARLSGATPPP